MHPRSIADALLFAALIVNPAAGEAAASFSGTVEVRVVNLEAVVTDGDGRRVPRLGPEAFRLTVDGAEVAIAYFSEIRDGDLVAPAVLAGPPASGARHVGDAVPTNYLVFIDELFPRPDDRDRALRGLVEDLEGLGPADAMAVMAYDGRRLERLADWTGSLSELEAACRTAMDRPTGGHLRAIEQQGVENRLELRHQASRLAEQTRRTLAAAGSALRVAQAPPGRKVLLLYSGGWPLDPSRLLPMTEHGYAAEHGLDRTREAFDDLVTTANLLGYTIYGVDMPGLEGTPSDVTDRGYDIDEVMGRPTTAVTGSLIQEMEIEVSGSEVERQKHDGLTLISHETGGQALLNAGVGHALARSVADTRTYYWLGFDAGVLGDDARHEIVIATRDPSLEVRSRSSFVDLSAAKETTMRVESALLFAAPDEPDQLVVELGEAEGRGLRRRRVPIEVRIPLGGMLAVPTEEGFEVRLELRLGALAEGGSASDIPVIPVVFQGPREPAPGAYGTYTGTLELGRDAAELLVTAYDPVLDQMLATRVPLEF